MGIGPFSSYAPPGVYTSTSYEQVTGALIASLKIPMLIGPSAEYKSALGVDLVRGSSASRNILVTNEDVAGQWVVSGSGGSVVLGSNDGSYSTFQVSNFPILSGDGTRTATFDTSKVSVTVDGVPALVLAVDGPNGLISIQAGVAGPASLVSVTYYCDRTDTRIVNEDLSNQVTSGVASYAADLPIDDLAALEGKAFYVIVDGTEFNMTFTSGSVASIAALKTFMAANASGLTVTHVLVGSDPKITLEAAASVVVPQKGNAFGLLGLTPGSTNRNTVFVTHYYPIVDGSNSGRATTSVSDVRVTVDDVVVIAKAVRGQTGEVELYSPPLSGSSVKVTYYFNEWKDTFDYLPNKVVSVTKVGIDPTKDNYRSGTDFIVVNEGDQSRIYWGSHVSTSEGTQNGDLKFGSDQVTATVTSTRFAEQPIGTKDSVNKVFTLRNDPVTAAGEVLSNGRNPSLTTDPDFITYKVAGITRDVLTVTNRACATNFAPGSSQLVLTDYYIDRLKTANYAVEVVSEGLSGSGTYEIKNVATGKNLLGYTSVSWTNEITSWHGGYYADPTSPVVDEEEYLFDINNVTKKYTVTGTTYGTDIGAPVVFNLGETAVLNDGFTFTVVAGTTGTGYSIGTSKTFTADTTFKNVAIPGIDLYVSNTYGAGVGSTALVSSYNLNATSTREPGVGSTYYVSYTYAKTNFETGVYTDLKSIVGEFGEPTPENQLSLAAKLAIQNGAAIVALKQVKKVGNVALPGSFISAIDDAKKPIAGKYKPEVIVPLTADTTVIGYLSDHCSFMSAPRQEGERMGVVGTSIGTTPSSVQTLARTLNSELMMVVYPDSFVCPVQDNRGQITNRTVDGTFVAAALAGSMCSPALDAASPITRRVIGGFTAVGRVLDPTEANQVAVAGVSVMEQTDAGIRVRHGLTTNVTDVLTRTPSVTMTVHDVQRSLRSVLDPFIGQKFTDALTKSVEQAARTMFQGKIGKQIVSTLVDLIVYVDQDDPTVLRLEAVYVPVFPLEYIVCNLSIRIRA